MSYNYFHRECIILSTKLHNFPDKYDRCHHFNIKYSLASIELLVIHELYKYYCIQLIHTMLNLSRKRKIICIFHNAMHFYIFYNFVYMIYIDLSLHNIHFNIANSYLHHTISNLKNMECIDLVKCMFL